MASTLANLGISMHYKAINSVIGKKLIDKGIQNIPNLVKYGSSKIKNKNIHQALISDIADCIVEETQQSKK